MSDARDEPAGGDSPPAPPAAGPLGLAARLRRETPVGPGPAIPAPARAPDPDDENVDDDYEPPPRVPLRERLRAREAAVDLLLFRVGEGLFATDLLAVEEAMELPDVHPVPGASPALLGVLGLRARAILVYSPERALAQPPRGAREAGHPFALVLRPPEGAARPVAIAVDDVEDVHVADMAEVRDLADAAGVGAEDAPASAPAAARRAAAGDVVLGVVHLNGELVALVDSDALVAACAAGGEGAARDLPARENP